MQQSELLHFWKILPDMLTNNRSIFFVGIKGQGIAALALVLRGKGASVMGSDTAETFSTDAVLARHHITVLPFAAPLPADVQTVIYSTAYQPSKEPQLVEAARRGLSVLSYPEALGELMRAMEGIAVAGSHGKTTTTAMIGHILAVAGKDPTVLVGSPVPMFGGNARIGRSSLLVVETDEYQDKLRHYEPRHLVVTNIDYDHPDWFASASEYTATFQRCIARLPQEGMLVTNADDTETSNVLQRLGRTSTTFGLSENAQYRLLSCLWKDGSNIVQLFSEDGERTLHLRVPGVHNALNALAAIAMCRSLRVGWEVIEQALGSFAGTARRFQNVGSYRGAALIDDFAHHPTEIAAAISAARQMYPSKNLVAVFHPHTYSRTKALLHDFAKSLTADEVILMEIFGSARETERTVSSADVVKNIPAPHHPKVLATVEDVVAYLRPRLSSSDVVLLLGAGEQWKIAKQLQGTNDKV